MAIILVIRLTLLLIPIAIANFLLAIALEQLMMTDLASLFSQLGSLTLLCAFALVLLAVFGVGIQSLAVSVCHYFSRLPRMERKLLFYMNEHDHLSRLFLFKKARVQYLSQQHRKRLLKYDERKPLKR